MLGSWRELSIMKVEREMTTRWRLLRHRHLPLLVIALTLAIFAATIYVVTIRLRQKVREQIAAGHAEVLHAVTQMLLTPDDALAGLSNPDLDRGGVAEAEPQDQVLALLQASRLQGVVAIRFFDSDGNLSGPGRFPPYVT